MGPVFEDICRDWLWHQLAIGKLDIAMTDVGRWWGNDPDTRSEAEIDIVAVDEGKTVLVGECKWRNEQTGADQLRKLSDRIRLVGGTSQTPMWLFSRAGFTDGCIQLAREMPNARLVTFAEMSEGKR